MCIRACRCHCKRTTHKASPSGIALARLIEKQAAGADGGLAKGVCLSIAATINSRLGRFLWAVAACAVFGTGRRRRRRRDQQAASAGRCHQGGQPVAQHGVDSPRATSAVLRDELRVRPARMSGDTLQTEDGVVVQRPVMALRCRRSAGLVIRECWWWSMGFGSIPRRRAACRLGLATSTWSTRICWKRSKWCAVRPGFVWQRRTWRHDFAADPSPGCDCRCQLWSSALAAGSATPALTSLFRAVCQAGGRWDVLPPRRLFRPSLQRLKWRIEGSVDTAFVIQ